MPRRRVAGTGGVVFHVMNRSAKQLPLFESPPDFQLFLGILGEVQQKRPMRLLHYCVMGNHFHLLVWPERDGDLTRYMRWITGVHGRRWRRSRGSTGKGAVYQGRYRWVGVQDAFHYDTCRRYVLQNPVRAGLCETPETWPWSSASTTRGIVRPTLSSCPWQELNALDSPLDGGTVESIRESLRASQNLGSPEWSHALAVNSWLTDVLARHQNAVMASTSEIPKKTAERDI